MPWILLLGPAATEGLFVGFLAFVAAIVLVGLSAAHSAVHGSQNTQGFWQWLSTGGAIRDLLGLGIKAARFVVSHFAASQLRVLARWLFSIGTLTGAWLGINAVFAEAVVSAIERVVQRGDPRARRKAQTANSHAIHAGRTATHANVHARSVGHALDHYKGRTDSRVNHLTHRVEVVLPHDIGAVKHRERWAEKQLWKVRDRVIGLEDGAIKTWEWIRDHPAGVAAGAFTAALATVLSWPGIRALRCNEFGNLFNKRGCGLWNDLESILLAVGVFGAALDFRDIVKAAVELDSLGAEAIHALTVLDTAAVNDAASAVSAAVKAVASAPTATGF